MKILRPIASAIILSLTFFLIHEFTENPAVSVLIIISVMAGIAGAIALGGNILTPANCNLINRSFYLVSFFSVMLFTNFLAFSIWQEPDMSLPFLSWTSLLYSFIVGAALITNLRPPE